MSRIERSYENCEIYDILQDHWQSLQNLFKGLLGSPVQSYENCESCKNYENCEIYDNSQDHWQSLRNLFKRLQGSPVQSYENCENYEIYENCEIYAMDERTNQVYSWYLYTVIMLIMATVRSGKPDYLIILIVSNSFFWQIPWEWG